MPIQNKLDKPAKIFNFVNTMLPKTPQQNKFRQIIQEKSSNKKRRFNSEPLKSTSPFKYDYKTPSKQLIASNKPKSPVNSPYYAGAKFNDAPLPILLPKPPTHWIDSKIFEDESKQLSVINVNTLEIDSTKNLIEEIKPAIEEAKDFLKKNTFVPDLKSKQENYYYNLQNSRRSTPQSQTKCKNNRYSFTRQNYYQKITAVN